MIKNKPFVSIGLITRNRASILPKAIECLQSQSYGNIELIISDNCSTDNTKRVCEKYAKKDKRIKYFRQKKNIGMYNNFNFVMNRAKGEFFMWATDDDKWDKNFVQHLVSLLMKHKKAVVACSNFHMIGRKETIVTDFNFREYINIPKSIATFINYPALVTYGIMRTRAVQKTGGFFIYPKPIPDGIGDILQVFRVLLQGGLVFDKSVLLYKNDSGHSLERYEHMKNLNFSPEIIFRMKRYLTFFVLYIYDLFYLLKYTFLSNHSLKNKILISLTCFKYYLKNNYYFFKDLVKGAGFIIYGVFKKTLAGV